MSLRCTVCGERIIQPVWRDGKPYCIVCAIRARQKEIVEKVRRRNDMAKSIVNSRK